MKISSIEKSMLLLIGFIACLLLARIYYSASFSYFFLLWNIFLAFIPLKMSTLLTKQKKVNVYSILFFVLWLLFFPNSLYLITDLIHLEQRQNIPLWYDALLLYTCASAGLIMAFISLYKIESFLDGKINDRLKNVVVSFCLFLGSFGVYLGRFLRWNSWNVLSHPVRTTTGIAERVLLPFDYTHTWAITLLFTGLFNILYFLIKRLPSYLIEPELKNPIPC
jgi:uncharacterized membrane protein